MSINSVVISGNLTRDPELRTTNTGTKVLGFCVAVNDRCRNPQTQEWEDYPNFIDCVLFGPRAESVAKYISKGSKVAVQGKLRWSQWERDGERRSKIAVIVDQIEFFVGGSTKAAHAGVSAPVPVMAAAIPSPDIYDHDMPF